MKSKLLIYAGVIIIIIAASGFVPLTRDMDPEKWVQVVVMDTTNVPLSKLNDYIGKVSLEKAAGGRKYDNMPSIERTRNLTGDFTMVGHSRIVYFSSGDTLVETIIAKNEPFIFGYEITKASLPMKRVAHRARGIFERHEIDGGRTVTKWTYSFQQKNLISKLLIKRYINTTHRQWMEDMAKTGKAAVESAYNSDLKKQNAEEE